MKITLINPNVVTQKKDFFGSGIPFMPITLAYTASYLKKKGFLINIIDAFGENPKHIDSNDEQFIQGLTTKEIINKIPKNTDAIIIYASLVITHNASIKIIKEIRKNNNKPIIVIENIHSVVGYSLLKVKDEFLDVGADYLVMGDPERRCENILKSIKKKYIPNIDGIIYKKEKEIVVRKTKIFSKEINEIPFPLWELFPIQNYWEISYSHAPFKKKYLPLLTSRGCPNNCEFCITPLLSGMKWRPRTYKNVIDEIEYYMKKFEVKEFHIEDFNPTVDKKRIKQICEEIIKRKININLKIVAGTKAETLDNEIIDLMKKAGFSYVSISPESGSKKMLKIMNKDFDYKHGLKIVSHMNKVGITSQACFVIGFPKETKKDLKLTTKYIIDLTKKGIDEIGVFIMTPIPGSRAFNYSPLGYKNLSQLTFSPKWRNNYNKLNKYRIKIYITFIILKGIYHPFKLIKSILNILIKNFNTKTEMALWRVIRMHIKSKIGGRL
jgi:radical SAM superfamily enzyme YgiQ (UPF0313 family)